MSDPPARWCLHRFESLTSTMDMCRTLAELNAPAGTVVMADQQTAGRGRHGHSWHSPVGRALYVSILLRPSCPPDQLWRYTVIGALAVARLLEDWIAARPIAPGKEPGPAVSIKWLNDVLLNQRKVAGVLVESALLDGQPSHLVLGIGLNLNIDFAAGPTELQTSATSISQVGLPVPEQDQALVLLLQSISLFLALSVKDMPAVLAQYRARLTMLGQRVRVEAGDTTIEGVAKDLGPDASLLIENDEGLHPILYGVCNLSDDTLRSDKSSPRKS